MNYDCCFQKQTLLNQFPTNTVAECKIWPSSHSLGQEGQTSAHEGLLGGGAKAGIPSMVTQEERLEVQESLTPRINTLEHAELLKNCRIPQMVPL